MRRRRAPEPQFDLACEVTIVVLPKSIEWLGQHVTVVVNFLSLGNSSLLENFADPIFPARHEPVTPRTRAAPDTMSALTPRGLVLLYTVMSSNFLPVRSTIIGPVCKIQGAICISERSVAIVRNRPCHDDIPTCHKWLARLWWFMR
jgi:hypothetical protein